MVTEADTEDVHRLVHAGAQLIEVLPAREFKEVHLPGARNIPLRRLDDHSVADLDRSRPVVVYCWDYL